VDAYLPNRERIARRSTLMGAAIGIADFAATRVARGAAAVRGGP
jgi:hypothetical protein